MLLHIEHKPEIKIPHKVCVQQTCLLSHWEFNKIFAFPFYESINIELKEFWGDVKIRNSESLSLLFSTQSCVSLILMKNNLSVVPDCNYCKILCKVLIMVLQFTAESSFMHNITWCDMSVYAWRQKRWFKIFLLLNVQFPLAANLYCPHIYLCINPIV
jgi:hypothetical protein